MGNSIEMRASTQDGLATRQIISAATTNAASIKATRGQVYGVQGVNNAAITIYVKLYNLAVAPTVGTSVPTQVFGIPPGGRLEYNRGLGVEYDTGLAVAITGGAANSDTTAVAVNDFLGSIEYK